MASSVPKLALSRSRDIPFDQLVLSQANVRRLKCGVSIGELADDIVRRTLLQSLNVRAVLDDDGNDTGKFEVPAGGRRFRALELLVKTKRMAKNQPVPCVVREGGSAEEDSLVENTMRMPLHPLDQFRAFKALRDAGTSEEEIAARFFAPVNIIKQGRPVQQGLVYSARIRLLQSTIRIAGQDQPIGPGLAVQAEIKTGERRIVDYLLSPLAKTVDEAGRER
jgi:ParB family chromosome partitioning protein